MAVARAEIGTSLADDTQALEAGLTARSTDALIRKAQEHRMVIPILRYATSLQPSNTFYAQAFKRRIHNNLSRVFAIQELYAACQRANIPILFYKGPALAIQLYGGIEKRDFGDIDCLIHVHDLPRIATVLAQLGYESETTWQNNAARAQFMRKRNEISFSKTGIQGKSSIDLHWRLTNPLYGIPLTTEEIFKVHAGALALTPKLEIPTFRMAALPVLLAIHHGGNDLWNKLRHLLDWGKLLMHPTAEIDWEASLRQAQALDVEFLLLISVALTHEVLGAPIPVPLQAGAATPRVQRWVRKRRLVLEHPDNLKADHWQYKLWFRWVTSRHWSTKKQLIIRALTVSGDNLRSRFIR